MVAYNTINVGDTLFDCHTVKMGNTTMSRMACFSVKIIELHPESKSATVSWNGNAPKKFYTRQLEKLRRTRKTE
jgi:hypothetical protein